MVTEINDMYFFNFHASRVSETFHRSIYVLNVPLSNLMYLNKINTRLRPCFQIHHFKKAAGVMSSRCLTLKQAAGERVTETEREQVKKHIVHINRSRNLVNMILRSRN